MVAITVEVCGSGPVESGTADAREILGNGYEILGTVNVEVIWAESHVWVFMGYKLGPGRKDQVSN